MKKTWTLLAATMLLSLFAHVATAQMKYIFEANALLSKKESIPGGMVFTTHKVPELSKHLLLATLGTYEKVLGGHPSHTLRGYGGLGYANERNTLAAGINVGAKTYLDGSQPEISYSFWAYAEKNRFSFTTIYIDWEAYLVEFAYRVSTETAKWQFSFLFANHGPNYGFAGKLYHQKSGFYLFAGPTGQWYKLQTNSYGQVEDASFVNPVSSPKGLHCSIGIEFGHK